MGLDIGAHHVKELPPVDALLEQILTGVSLPYRKYELKLDTCHVWYAHPCY
jgi:hypothetical protein